jgi:hypothetical protein
MLSMFPFEYFALGLGFLVALLSFFVMRKVSKQTINGELHTLERIDEQISKASKEVTEILAGSN